MYIEAYPTEPPVSALELRRVTLLLQGVRALDGVSLLIPPGSVTAVIGPSGAGKTALLNCVSGLHQHEGDILLGDASLVGLHTHQRLELGLARTYQTPTLLDDLSAIDNVLLGVHPLTRRWAGGQRGRANERDVRRRAAKLLVRLGVSTTMHRLAGDLPDGDRRRVEVARALLARPRVLLLDEPTVGMPADEARDLLRVATELCETCVLIEPDMTLVMEFAQQVAVLAAGRLHDVGIPQEIVAGPQMVDACLGDGATT